MFKKTTAFSGFSVNDLAAAKKFYHGILGLNVREGGEMPILELLIENGGNILIYEKANHLPATYTVLNFPVKNIRKAVEQLKRSGIEFLQYEGDIKTDKDGISHNGGPLIAWFKDPAENILSVIQQD